MLQEAGACGEEMRKVREKINERDLRFLELAERSNNNRMAAEGLEEEIRGLQAGEERRGSCALQSKTCGLDAVVEQLFTLGATHARQQIQALQEDSSGDSRSQPLLCTWQEEKIEEKRWKRSKRKEQPVAKWVRQRQVGVMKAFWLFLFLILLGTTMQTVRAVEQEISSRHEMDRILEKGPVPAQTAATDASG